MSTTVCFINTAANRTSARSVPGVNQNNRNTSASSLVFDVGTKLIKRPVSVPASLLAANRCLTNALQIFQSNASSSVLRLFYKPLTDYVVDVRLKSGLLPGQSLEFALGRFCVFALKAAATMLVFPAIFVNYLAAKNLSVTISCKMNRAAEGYVPSSQEFK